MNLFACFLAVVIVLLLLCWLNFQDKRIDGLTDKMNSLQKRKIIGISTNYQNGFNKVVARMTEENWGEDEIRHIDTVV